ncbi:hypothetical protein [Actinomadura rudentiformis]|uniref:Nuclear transport factor 2 family protein n=1 Tax=Actinomadura rudentiformis TaxID=359158 RepID=A0A6H9YCT6_9ACTN|nr:hypothetical protein [Actinomadura rudentiformis]KAB2341309.1 hypothetical protein F8566_42070 [Actinomadura rudentiformis]
MRGESALPFMLLVSACTAPAGATGMFQPNGAQEPSHAMPQPPGGQAALSAYRRFHEAFERALETNDPSLINEVTTGPEARHLHKVIRANRRAGLIQRSHAVPHPRLTALRAPTAQIIDCVTTSGMWTYRARTGARVGAPPKPQRNLLYATLHLTNGTWKVSNITHPRNPKC